MPAQLAFTAKPTASDYSTDDVLDQLRKIDGVVTVAKSNTADGLSGFVVFESAELAAAARNRVDASALYVLEDPAREPPARAPRVRKEKKPKSATKVDFTADFFNGPSPSTMKSAPAPRRGRGGRGGADGSGRGAGPEEGGRGRGRRGGGPRRPPTIQAHAVCAHNVPFNVTNDQVFAAFKHAGHIYDIRRMERIALLLMRDPESVTEAIVTMNGKEMWGSKLAVCGGGEMRLPVPPPPPGPDMPPHGSPLVNPPPMAPPVAVPAGPPPDLPPA